MFIALHHLAELITKGSGGFRLVTALRLRDNCKI